jgi:hypothetical protein
MTWGALLSLIGEKTKTAWLVAALTVAGLIAFGFVADRVERRRREKTDFALWDAEMAAHAVEAGVDLDVFKRGTRRLIDDLLDLDNRTYDVWPEERDR